MSPEQYLRIGELSRRTGVSVELLRAWEKRYGLLEPARSQGGFRLYSDDDAERVLAMRSHLGNGLAAAEAARRALAPEPAGHAPAGGVEQGKDDLAEALATFAEARAHASFDRMLASLTLDTVLADVVLPYLHELGESWARGETTVAQEHFASNLLRGRLLGLARGWGAGVGPHALLACPPGELHDLGLLVFGLALRSRGWRITYLGQDTPLSTIAEQARALGPDHVVLALSSPERLDEAVDELAALAAVSPVSLGGAGATPQLAEQAGVSQLAGDPVTEADRLTATRGAR
ncbi:MAG TPA: cobalamin B12-binding domain-containing protein [Gaiellaceae bacterium]|nr:cobalamin B12-binding domain-containing protein [Gaiellaceae bacterium]